jgi:hypothetical protein
MISNGLFLSSPAAQTRRRIDQLVTKKLKEKVKMTSQHIKETLTYLDPCGMEATDDIIDSLVGEQLDKVGNLLKRARVQKKKMINGGKERGALGSRDNPFILGTACSGTDAPALALMLVQEQLEKRGMGNLFKHDHGEYISIILHTISTCNISSFD